jgi:Ca-activated chloride channel homolog
MDWAHPKLLLLALPAFVLLLWFESRSAHSMHGLRKRLLLIVRAVIVLLALLALAGPARVTQTGKKALGILVDASQSMGKEGFSKALETARSFQKQAGGSAETFVVRLGSQPELLSNDAMPDATQQALWQKENGGDSHYSAAIEFALALFPAGASRDLILIGDGHETHGSLLSTAQEAAVAGTRLHVFPIAGPQKPDARLLQLTPNR